MGAPTPQFLPSAFGIGASSPAFINTIPTTTVSPGRASFTLGFPPVTMTPKIAGGVPPFGQDVNGILYMLSTHAYAQQAGQAPLWSAPIAAAIAGYAIGTVLGSTDGSTLYFNTVAANVTDPDAGGAGWVTMYSYGITYVVGLTGGSTTLTSAQYRRNVISLGGTLLSNQIIVLPADVRSWLIANNTTGAFTLTVKTASGTGTVVPQGGFSGPVGVYGDGTNIYPTVTPLSIPTAEGPTPSTYPIRSAAGYLYATFFNMSGGADNLAVTHVVYENGGDGFLRKMTQANFRAQLFDTPAFTGVPTAPTAAVNTNTTQLATTAFVQAAVAPQTTYSGWVDASATGFLLPAGWGATFVSTGRIRVTHNLSLVTPASLAVVASVLLGGSTDDRYCNILNIGANSFDISIVDTGSGAVNNAVFFHAKRVG